MADKKALSEIMSIENEAEPFTGCTRWVLTTMRLVEKGLKPGSRVLDLGAGAGICASWKCAARRMNCEHRAETA